MPPNPPPAVELHEWTRWLNAAERRYDWECTCGATGHADGGDLADAYAAEHSEIALRAEVQRLNDYIEACLL